MATSPPGSLVTPTVPPGWGRPVPPSQVRKQQMRDVAFRPGSSDRPVGKAGLLLRSSDLLCALGIQPRGAFVMLVALVAKPPGTPF